MHAELSGKNPGYYSAVLGIIQIETMSTYYKAANKCFKGKVLYVFLKDKMMCTNRPMSSSYMDLNFKAPVSKFCHS